jgi:hypothetical protein
MAEEKESNVLSYFPVPRFVGLLMKNLDDLKNLGFHDFSVLPVEYLW